MVFIREDSRERSFSVEKTKPKFYYLYSVIQTVMMNMVDGPENAIYTL